MAVNYPPVFRYISPGLLNNMRREMDRFFTHTYSRLPRIPPAVTEPPTPLVDDDWGLPVTVFAAPGMPVSRGGQIDNLPCFYLEKEIPIVTATGLITLNTPFLYTRFDDPLQEGDRVINVQTLDGIVLQDGPMLVEQTTPYDPNQGGPVYSQAQLRRVKMLPSS